MKKNYNLLLLLVIFSISGCGGLSRTSISQKPDWIDGGSAQYPITKYIIGIGHYKYLSGAKKRAQDQLAKVFNVSIQKQITKGQKFTPDQFNPKIKQSTRATYVYDYLATTESILAHANIMATWRNPDTFQFYALAVLKRSKAADAIRQEIIKLDEITRSNIQNSTTTHDKLQRLLYADGAIEPQVNRKVYQRALEAVSTNNSTARSVWSIEKLRNDFNKLLKRIYIKPRVLSDDSGFLRRALERGISDAGASIGKGEDIDYILSATLRLSSRDQRGNMVQTAGTVDIQLRDLDGKLRGSKKWSIQPISAPNTTALHQKAADVVTNLLVDNLSELLITFAK